MEPLPLSTLLQGMRRSNQIQLGDIEKIEAKVLADPFVRELWARHPELDRQTLRLNLSKLYQCVKERSSCESCPGLERCPNDYPGHYTEISAYETGGTLQLHDRKMTCSRQIAKDKQDAVGRRIRSFYVDERVLLEGCNFKELVSIDLERADAVDRLMDYIMLTRTQGLQRRGLYLTGDLGTGKTFLISYMLHELAKLGHSGVIVYMPDFVEDLKAMFGENGKLKETMDLLKETDLLVFDDLGAENLNPWVRDHVMGTILNYRMNRKPTFFTSNYGLDGLEKHMRFTSKDGDEELKGQRIMERIRPFVDVIHVGGSNKRGI